MAVSARPPRSHFKDGVVSNTPSLGLHFVIPISVTSHGQNLGALSYSLSIISTFFRDTRNKEFSPYGNPQLDDKSGVPYIANRSLAILEGG